MNVKRIEPIANVTKIESDVLAEIEKLNNYGELQIKFNKVMKTDEFNNSLLSS